MHEPSRLPEKGDRDGHDAPPRHRKFPFGAAIAIAVAALVVVALVVVPRLTGDRKVEQSTEQMAVPTVTILHPQSAAAETDLVLPGNVQPWIEAPLAARTNGYLKDWKADIGARVKAGDLLAEIETPEIDQQLDQARAALAQNQANLALSKTTADRWAALYRTNAVSEQENQEKQADLAVQTANVAAAAANVRNLEAQQSFQKITAPFDGIVTSRTTDVGALINAGSGAGQELFRIADIHILRVYVSVPEVFAASMKIGTEASLRLASAPGVPVTGKIAETAGAINPQSRTLLVQLQIPNQDGKLLPGGYGEVHFHLVLDHAPLVLPANTLIFRSAGSQVGVVPGTGDQGTVSLRKVRIGRDFGNTVEIADGIQADDRVILNPSDSLTDGLQVRVKEQEKKAADPAKK